MSSGRSGSAAAAKKTTTSVTETKSSTTASTSKSPARRTSSFAKEPEAVAPTPVSPSTSEARPASGNRRASSFSTEPQTVKKTTAPSAGVDDKKRLEPKSPARRTSSFAKEPDVVAPTPVSPSTSEPVRPGSGTRRVSTFAEATEAKSPGRPTSGARRASSFAEPAAAGGGKVAEPRRGSVGRRDSSTERGGPTLERKSSVAGGAPLADDPTSTATRNEDEFADFPVTPWEHVNRQYTLHGPSVDIDGAEVKAVIEGKLFRVVKRDDDSGEESWYFYNDTTEYEMQILLKFAAGSKMRLGAPEDVDGKSREGRAKLEMMPGGGQNISISVFPNQTRLACVGNHKGCGSLFTGKALTEAYHKMHAADTDKLVQPEIAIVQELCPKYVLDDEVVAICVRTGTKFIDLSFPPVYNSIYRDGIDTNFITPYPWRRPSDALPKDHAHEARLFVGGINPADIDQGVLGNCWFLAAIACLAEFPEKIKDIFRHPVSVKAGQKERKMGAYRVTLNINGWWRVMIVDDYLPMSVVRSSFARTREDPRELWVSLLEKAYAKARGSYANIIGGDALEALEDLTGFPVNRFDTEWEEAVAAKDGGITFAQNLVKYDKQNFLVVLNTPGYDPRLAGEGVNDEEQEAKYKAAGLALGHAYTVMKTVYVESLNLFLLNIRNPWGDGIEWTGAWGDNSPKWDQHPEVRDQVGFVKAKDSQFWMAWEDVRRHFCGGGVCFLKFGWHDYRVQGEFEVGGTPSIVFEIRCTKKIDVFFVLSQADERDYVGQPESEETKYAAIMLSVSRTKSGSVQEVHLSSTLDVDQPAEKYQFNYARDVAVQYTLDPTTGPFFVIPRIHETTSKRPYALGMISSVPPGPNLSVKFVKILPDNPVFKNMKGFQVDKVLEVYTKWQYNPDVGGPKEFQGNTLRFLS